MMRGWLNNETVYFTSARDFEYSLGSRLHQKNINNAQAEVLTMQAAYQGSPSPDEKKWAYIKNGDPSNRQRSVYKRYRCSGMRTIELLSENTQDRESLRSGM